MILAITFVGDWPAPLRQAGEQVLAALQAELGAAAPAGTINIKLVDDAAIAALNKQYNGNAYATDVLTFNYSEDGSNAAGGELADMVISAEMAAKQAAQAGTTLSDEVGLLVAHGLLHALGHDHDSAASRSALDGLQRRIVAAAGLRYRDFQWVQ